MRKKNTFVSTVLISIIVCFGKILGFVKQAFIAWAFGATGETDIYFAADGYISIFGQIQMASIAPNVLTEYIKIREKNKQKDSIYFLRKCFLVFPLIGIIIIILNILFSEYISEILGISYTFMQRKILQKYIICLCPVILFTAVSSVSQGVLDANGRFLPSKLLSLIFSTFIISFVFLFHDILGIKSLLIGFLLGYAVHTIYVFVLAKRYFTFGGLQKTDSSFVLVLKNVVPLIIGNSIVDLGHLIDNIIASSLTSGSVSYLSYGQIISSGLVNAVIITPVGTVLLPLLTEIAVNTEDKKAVAKNVGNILAIVITILLIITDLYILECSDFIRLFFERGKFTHEVTKNISVIAICYAIGFVFIAIREILAKVHYAYQDTVSPMRNGIMGVIINVFLSLILSRLLGIVGIALATSISMIVVSFMMCLSLKKHIGTNSLKEYLGMPLMKSVFGLVIATLTGTLIRMYMINSKYIIRMFCVVSVTLLLYISILLYLYRYQISRKKFYKKGRIMCLYYNKKTVLSIQRLSKGIKNYLYRKFCVNKRLGGGRYGRVKAQTVCVLQIKRRSGWSSYMVDYILPNILYCEKKRWIPVIDMQSYDNEYSKARDENIWDCFYQQPGNISLKDAFNNANEIILRECVPGCWSDFKWNPRDIFDYGKNQQKFYDLWNRYFKLKEELIYKFEEVFYKLTNGYRPLLGCSFRGTDYTENKPYGHYIQPSIEQGIVECKKMMSQHNCERLLLSTEDIRIYDAYREEFGEKMFALDEFRYDSGRNLWATIEKTGKEEVYKYLLSKYMVSKCDYFVAGINGGTTTILGMNGGKFKDCYFFKLGKYGK